MKNFSVGTFFLCKIICCLSIISAAEPEQLFSQPKPLAIVPTPDHIVILIMENHGYDNIIGADAAPNINTLAYDSSSALFTQSFAIEHPSQPNYLDFYSGCNQGVTDDGTPTDYPFTTDNLGRQLLDAGKTFVTYSEDLPKAGFDGASSANYARKHNPATNWVGTDANQIPATVNQPFKAFPTDFTQLPTVSYVIPNLNNDMHNGTDPQTITIGDTWMHKNLDAYIKWARTHNSLFILTFDEDDYSGSNQITTIFYGPMVKGGDDDEMINHYAVLRTIEDMYGLPHACNAETTDPIKGCWTAASGVTSNESSSSHSVFSLYPNPSNGDITIHFEDQKVGKLESIEITNMLGEKIFEEDITNTIIQNLPLKHFASGSYLVKVSDGKRIYSQKMVVQ